MKLYRLMRYVDAGFSVNVHDLGLFSTREKAEAEAEKREPNKSIRDYEYAIGEETVK